MVVDQELYHIIDDCKTGNRKAQELLFRQSYPFAIRVALRYSRDELDASDILSHAFVKVFKSVGAFDPAKGNFYGWLKKIIINESLDHIKQRSRTEVRELQEAAAPFISNHIIEKINFDDIMVLVRQLPPATHAVFVLFAIDGYSHKEIGQQLSISEGTSKWHLSEARKFLQQKLTVSTTS